MKYLEAIFVHQYFHQKRNVVTYPLKKGLIKITLGGKY